MISFILEHPRSWSASVDAALAHWPAALCCRREADEPGSSPMVHAWFRDEPLSGLPIPLDASSVSAMVIGRLAMGPSRLTCWFGRVSAMICDAQDAQALAALGTPDSFLVVPLPAGDAAATVARASIRSAADGLERLDDLILLVSELATNAVLHAGGAQELSFHRGRDAVVIALTDRSVTSAPAVGRLGTTSPTGRGMAIVDSLSDQWGVTLTSTSKTVWCEVLLGIDG